MIPRTVAAGLTLCATVLTPAAQEAGSDSPIAEAVEQADAAIAAILARPEAERTFANTVRAIDDVQASFFHAARMPGFMADVSTDAAERAAGRQAKADLSNWFDRLYQNEELFRAVQGVAESAPPMEGEDAVYLSRLLRDYRRAGMGADPQTRARLAEIDEALTEVGIEFSRNIADDESVVYLHPDECTGVPADILASLPQEAGLLVVELKGSVVRPFWALCEIPDTRKKLSLAYSRRGGQKNVAVLERMIALRAEKARLLGYPSTAAYEVEVKMAATPETVLAFYDELRPKLRRKAEQDFAEFQEAKRQHTGDPEAVFEAWDYSFYQTYLMREKYAVDNEKVREYFPIDQVIVGIFDLYQELFQLRFVDITGEAGERGRPLWHDDVRLYEVWDTQSGELLGEFYTDLHPRPGKYSHAAQFPLMLRKRWPDGQLSRSLVALVCNFTKPTADKPALLTHNEVETFFHEFGHCLHSILNESEYAEFSGTSVARDFVEAPSQMLENWIWDARVLARFAKHYQTGEPLPTEMVEGMIAAKNLGSGLSAEGQVFLGLMDFTYHSDPDGEVDTTAVREEVYRQTRLFEPVPGLFSQASFGHLNGYHAGYYGYLWSLVYAQDMFSRFAEGDILDPKVADEYRRRVLAPGGSHEALDLVRSFLGREPNSDAFLRHLGLE